MLPNIETICDKAFFNWRRVTSAALGTNGKLNTLGAYIFANNTDSLIKIDFGTSSEFSVSNNTFLANETTPCPIEEIWFSDKSPSVKTLDNILALRTVGEDGSKPVKIYAPMMEDSWKALCQPFTSEERAAARKIKKQTGHRVVGVYETQDGRRVAWLMQNPNFEYTTGVLFIIR